MPWNKIGLNSQEFKDAVESICSINPNFAIWPEFEKTTLQEKVSNYLKSLDQIALTFTLNQLRGTPSFILFNAKHEVLSEWFGHISYQEVAVKIKQFSKLG